jgi:hypothetical protein
MAKKRAKAKNDDRRAPRACELVILADAPETEIWLGNDHGHLIQRATGTLKASLVPGEYTVEFGLGSFPYPIRLEQSMEYRQSELVENYGNPGSNPKS